jgi:hypothetical protein
MLLAVKVPADSLEKSEKPGGLSVVPFPSVGEIPHFAPADYKYGINLIILYEKENRSLGFPVKLKRGGAPSCRISRNEIGLPTSPAEHVIYPLECKLVVTKIAQAMPIFKV